MISAPFRLKTFSKLCISFCYLCAIKCSVTIFGELCKGLKAPRESQSVLPGKEGGEPLPGLPSLPGYLHGGYPQGHRSNLFAGRGRHLFLPATPDAIPSLRLKAITLPFAARRPAFITTTKNRSFSKWSMRISTKSQ